MPLMFDVNHVSFAHQNPGSLPHRALREISFQIHEGEYVSIVGANGSGKSTLAKHLSGLLIPQQGLILIAGKNSRDKNNLGAIHQLVGMVFQHPQEQMIASTVEEDVAFGPENLGLPTSEIQERVKQALLDVDMWDQRTRAPQHLSAGQMQRVALAGILAMRPKCVIFDETTAMLDPAGRIEVLESIEKLRRQGITIISISHLMEEACLAERILALSKGKLIFDGSPVDLFTNKTLIQSLNLNQPRILSFAHQLRKWIPSLQNPMTLEEFDRQINPLANPIIFGELNRSHFAENVSNPIVECQNLTFTYMQDTPLAHTALEDISFSIPEGSIHGLIGATGSGKSTLIQHFNGLYFPQKGKLRVGSFEVNRDVDFIELRRYAGIVFQNPNYQLFEQYVGDEIAYGLRLLGVEGQELRKRVSDAMNMVGMDFENFKDRMTFALSGGEKRKVALASTLVLNPTLLLLDEPTAGLDPVARSEILNQMKTLHENGKTLVVSSHQLEDLALLTDHVTLLSEGHVIASQMSDQLLSDHQLLKENKMIAPIAAQMVNILRTKGWMVPENIIISQQLIAAFEQIDEDKNVSI
jgi:energy-coupling factor transporter ATPase